MALKLVKLAEGAGVGLLDIGLEKLDEMQGWTAPMNAQTVGRAGLFALGLIGSAMGKPARWVDHLETLYIAEEPLLIRSLAKLGGLIADYAEAPSREAIELRLRQAGQIIPRGARARFR